MTSFPKRKERPGLSQEKVLKAWQEILARAFDISYEEAESLLEDKVFKTLFSPQEKIELLSNVVLVANTLKAARILELSGYFRVYPIHERIIFDIVKNELYKISLYAPGEKREDYKKDILFVFKILGAWAKVYEIEKIIDIILLKAVANKPLIVALLSKLGNRERAKALLREINEIRELLRDKYFPFPSQKETAFSDLSYYKLHQPQRWSLASIITGKVLSGEEVFQYLGYIKVLSLPEIERVLEEIEKNGFQNGLELLEKLAQERVKEWAEDYLKVTEKFIQDLKHERKFIKRSFLKVTEELLHLVQTLEHLFLPFLKIRYKKGEEAKTETIDELVYKPSIPLEEQSFDEMVTTYRELQERLLNIVLTVWRNLPAPLIDPERFWKNFVARVEISKGGALKMWEEILGTGQPHVLVLNERTGANSTGVLGFSKSFCQRHGIATDHLRPPLLERYIEFLREAEQRDFTEKDIERWKRELGWEKARIIPLQYIRISSTLRGSLHHLKREDIDRLVRLFGNIAKLNRDAPILFVDPSGSIGGGSNAWRKVLQPFLQRNMPEKVVERIKYKNPWPRRLEQPELDDILFLRGSWLGDTSLLQLIFPPNAPLKLPFLHPWLGEQTLSSFVEYQIGRYVENHISLS